MLITLKDCLENPGAQISERYLANFERFCALEDGKASQRVIDAFFFARNEATLPVLPEGSKHILIYGGDLDDGVQFSALKALLAAIRKEGHITTLIIDRHVVVNDPQRTANAQSLLGISDVLIRFGRAGFSLEGAWINDELKTLSYQPSEEKQALLKASLRHEAARLFGRTRFDAVLDFSAARAFWTNLLTFVSCERRLIRLTGDTKREMERRGPQLRHIHANLPRFDIVMSESSILSKRNRESLDYLQLPDERFSVLGSCIWEQDLSARAERSANGSAAEAFIAAGGLRLLGVPGLDHEAADRMLRLLSDLVETGREATLGLLVPAGFEAELIHAVSALKLWNQVIFLKEDQDLAPLMPRASCIMLADDLPGGAQVQAEARHLGARRLILEQGTQAQDMAVLSAALSTAQSDTPQTGLEHTNRAAVAAVVNA